MVNQRFHRLVDAGPWRRRDLLVLDSVIALGHFLHALAHDLDRLFDLSQLDREPVETIPVATDGNVEFDLVVGQIRHVSAKIPTASGCAKKWASGAKRQALGFVQDADTLQTVTPQRLTVHERVVLIETGHDRIEIFDEILLPPIVQVCCHASRADVVVVHSQTRGLLEEPQQRLALAPAVNDHRHRAEVEAVGRHEQQV